MTLSISSSEAKLAIVLCFDRNYMLPALVVMHSALSRAADPSTFHFNLFVSECGSTERKSIEKVVNSFGSSCTFFSTDVERYGRLPTRPGLTRDAYSRLYAADVLTDFDRFLYLDCDLLVLSDLTPLFKVNLGDSVAGGVRNAPAPFIELFNKTHGFEPNSVLVNSGVLLIDTAAWCKLDVAKKVADWIASNQEKLIFRDQDGINFILNGRIFELPYFWNVESRLREETALGISTVWDKEFANSIRIIHYTGNWKPWAKNSSPFHTRLWWSHYNEVQRLTHFGRQKSVFAITSHCIKGTFRRYCEYVRFKSGKFLKTIKAS